MRRHKEKDTHGALFAKGKTGWLVASQDERKVKRKGDSKTVAFSLFCLSDRFRRNSHHHK
ncbi:hypothetical protein [Atlantibacter hermannii]|uniref:hypothetical protein n=1 Tax=Atlantibacter hermannii TaxID=565 RepID=UPI001931AE76|nr:hypothetical protein [Atlantibacter hermannii]MBL7635987.1 hypothetical protein [Atlantibacter hermannii]MBL7672607.1 hypothetical protein [Atlantibacter hermannii]MCZ7836859.1 hypothetical protein [Atlantibacter hermannii]